jgi:hypothetical protein
MYDIDCCMDCCIDMVCIVYEYNMNKYSIFLVGQVRNVYSTTNNNNKED